MRKVEIVPSLLSADFTILASEIKKVERSKCRMLHLDVMDGHFVPNITIGPVVVKAVRRRTGLYLQVHLMIEEPRRYICDFQRAGADGIIIHQESRGNTLSTLKYIRRLGLDAGIALRPATPVQRLKNLLCGTDMLLIMSVEPGFGAQPFIKGSEKKVRQAKAFLEACGRRIPIGVDGGINSRTISLAVSAGAVQLIAGNAVFSGNAEKNIDLLYRTLELRNR